MAFRTLYSKWLSRDNDENRGQGTIVAENFLSTLRIQEVISRDEIDRIHKGRDTNDENVILFLDILPAKRERGLINVINILQHVNPSAAKDLVQLSKQLKVELNLNLLVEFETNANAIETPATISTESIIPDNTTNEIIASLKAYQKDSANYVYDYWNKFGLVRTDLWQDFYNYDLEITDPCGKRLTNIRNLETLFDQAPFKRIVVTAEAGYGKSTFVHEMVHQWIGGGQKFWFVFLFRLGELQSDESWETMLQRCLAPKHTERMKSFLSEDRFLEKSLFVFDGLDEVDERRLPQDVKNLIYGHGLKTASVVVATRQSKLAGLREVSGTWMIKLKGLTDVGLQSLLQKFSIDSSKQLHRDEYEILKCPLFATLYGIVAGDLGNSEINLCVLIDKYVKFLLDRYRRSYNVRLDEKTERKIMLRLGEAALVQLQILRMKSPRIWTNVWHALVIWDNWKKARFTMPDFRQKYETIFEAAKCAGLIHQNSTCDNLCFPHIVFASFLAAYFLCWKCTLKIKKVHSNRVSFKNPDRFECHVNANFPYFLTYFSKSFASELWQKCNGYIPQLLDYDSLPNIVLDPESYFYFPNVSTQVQKQIFEKIDLCPQKNVDIKVAYLKFEEIVVYEKLRQFDKLKLHLCDIRCRLEKFFLLYNNVTDLEIFDCDFHDLSHNSELIDVNSGFTYNLTSLTLRDQQLETSYTILNVVFENCHYLQFLCIKDMDDLDFNLVRDKMVQHAHLKTLRLSFVSYFNKDIIVLQSLPCILARIRFLEFDAVNFLNVSGQILTNLFTAVNSNENSIHRVTFTHCEFNHNFSIAEALPSFNFTNVETNTVTGVRLVCV